MAKLPLLMADSSIPPSGPLKGFSAQAGYIGGDTPHVWTNREWARFRHFPKLPIYVDDFRTGKAAGIDDGWKCLERLYSIGMPAGKGLAVAYDIETSKDAARALGFAEILNWAGFLVWLYGSRSTVLTIPFNDYWVADYTNVAHWPTRNSRACQFRANVPVAGEPNIDISCIRFWQVKTRKLWK